MKDVLDQWEQNEADMLGVTCHSYDYDVYDCDEDYSRDGYIREAMFNDVRTSGEQKRDKAYAVLLEKRKLQK